MTRSRAKTPWWRDRSAVIRTTAVAASACLALAGCGALMPGGNTGGGGLAVAAGPGPGVSDDSVKVVFVAVDLDAIQKLTGFVTAPVGDQEAQIQALEDWVNDNGGLGGKKLDAVFRLYDGQNDSPATEEQLCNQVTQDDKAFAVVLTGQFQSNARPCYAQRETLMLDATLYASDTAYYEELAPYLWSPSFPEYDSFIRAYVAATEKQGFFEGQKSVGVVAADSPVNRRAVEEVGVPLLKEAGLDVQVGWVDPTDMGTLYAGQEQAADTFRSKGVQRVMFFGGSRLASIFASIAAGRQFTPRYSISSFDNPSFFINNPDLIPDGTMDGMIGIGFHPPQDVSDELVPFPDPDNAAEVECFEVYKNAGITFESRESARVALPYCDAARMLKIGADNASGDLNAQTWSDAMAANGEGVETAAGFGGALDRGRAGAGGYRAMRFDDECQCFVYDGDVELFE
ncbi:ABC transporter substrate-binding protein [Nocardioides sp. zg-DK7169]|uniref:ABC transporter substrate-binding protein n=1 Tax=Nocardioides sp. zg-DK7169 TaxID=2736600 RepID=UPI001551D8F0|nr:ABC transporter substrate-binding protein [Nocardioides sp. zg-DK7169]NPC97674.1 ABC transporter substrate-binding protein [Nocardioides sp. zg-DK7169]